jgi:Ca2+/Na+ antiporter
VTSAPDTRQLSAAGELILAGSWLTCAVAMALPMTLWWANDFAGDTGMIASGIAAGLSWLASLVALVVRTRFPKPQDVVVGTLGAMLVRMVMILGGAMLIAGMSPELVKAAFWGQVVIYFLLTLAVETILAVRWVKQLEAASGEESSLPESSVKAI